MGKRRYVAAQSVTDLCSETERRQAPHKEWLRERGQADRARTAKGGGRLDVRSEMGAAYIVACHIWLRVIKSQGELPG